MFGNPSMQPPFRECERTAMDQDDHRSKARECVVLAGQARQPGDQLELLAIAQAFLRLATFTAQQRPRDAAASLPQAVVEAAGRSL
jgi:hypothetical protein